MHLFLPRYPNLLTSTEFPNIPLPFYNTAIIPPTTPIKLPIPAISVCAAPAEEVFEVPAAEPLLEGLGVDASVPFDTPVAVGALVLVPVGADVEDGPPAVEE
jgi:hypothetical protein